MFYFIYIVKLYMLESKRGNINFVNINQKDYTGHFNSKH